MLIFILNTLEGRAKVKQRLYYEKTYTCALALKTIHAQKCSIWQDIKLKIFCKLFSLSEVVERSYKQLW